MELRNVLSHRSSNARSPLHADAWERLLGATGLLRKYPNLPHSLRHGFNAGIPCIYHTYTPPNASMSPSLSAAFAAVVATEFQRGRYLGPFTKLEVESALGPFQSSPISMCPKPNKPNKFRLVQNFSHPQNPRHGISSINSALDSDLYPCTWGTFNTICTILHSLPPGSQAAVRDVAEAYRTIPLAASQWPGTVVRLDEDSFAIDTSNPFGLSPAGGIFGQVADAGKDLFLAHGIGPTSKWVDDHMFFRILRQYLRDYNRRRRTWAADIEANGGAHYDGGRLWYQGRSLANGKIEQFDEDMAFPLRDLSASSPRSETDAQFSYCLSDIDKVSDVLGYPWEPSKDIPFCSAPVFIGFIWDIPTLVVSLTTEKKARYLAAIVNWETAAVHTLEEVQKLHGKLLHASLIQPAGRAYLTRLERMLGIFHDCPFMPRTPPAGTAQDLIWWKAELSRPTFSRAIPGPCTVLDVSAFSDASTSFGIGITVGRQWRAWRLVPGWKTDERDIGWAEAVGFLFLVLSILPTCSRGTTYKIYGDNIGVVEGWRSGRSRNRPTNSIFKLIHSTCEVAGITFITRYVPSKSNPADEPSRGIFGHSSRLLPAIAIPTELQSFVTDYDQLQPERPAPRCAVEPRPNISEHRTATQTASHSAPHPITAQSNSRASSSKGRYHHGQGEA